MATGSASPAGSVVRGPLFYPAIVCEVYSIGAPTVAIGHRARCPGVWGPAARCTVIHGRGKGDR